MVTHLQRQPSVLSRHGHDSCARPPGVTHQSQPSSTHSTVLILVNPPSSTPSIAPSSARHISRHRGISTTTNTHSHNHRIISHPLSLKGLGFFLFHPRTHICTLSSSDHATLSIILSVYLSIIFTHLGLCEGTSHRSPSGPTSAATTAAFIHRPTLQIPVAC